MTNETKQKTLEKETFKNLETLVATIKDTPLERHPIADFEEKFKKRSGITSARIENCKDCGGYHMKAGLYETWYISGNNTLREMIEELNKRIKGKLPRIEYYVTFNRVKSIYCQTDIISIDIDTIHVCTPLTDDLNTIATFNYNVNKKNLLRSSTDRLKSNLQKYLGTFFDIGYIGSRKREMLEENKAETVNTLKECVEILKLKTK